MSDPNRAVMILSEISAENSSKVLDEIPLCHSCGVAGEVPNITNTINHDATEMLL